MIEIRQNGITRLVFLTRRSAIKIPRVRYGWAMFLRGLLSNMGEAKFSVVADEFALCPTLFSFPGGFLNVQPRCEPLDAEGWALVVAQAKEHPGTWARMECDFKRDNFGCYRGRVVLLDYGELT